MYNNWLRRRFSQYLNRDDWCSQNKIYADPFTVLGYKHCQSTYKKLYGASSSNKLRENYFDQEATVARPGKKYNYILLIISLKYLKRKRYCYLIWLLEKLESLIFL